jgi:hypothetical protein
VKVSHRSVVPNPAESDADYARFVFTDVSGLSEIDVFAERTILTAELSRLVFHKIRERTIAPNWTDRQWLRQRLQCLKDRAQDFKRAPRTKDRAA